MKNTFFSHNLRTPPCPKRNQYIEVPLPVECSSIRTILHIALGIILEPFYVAAALISKTPGVRIHLKCALWGLRMLLLRRLPLHTALSLVFFPMDSTRYFEFHEVLKRLAQVRFTDYLDVSSPRIVPLMLLARQKDAIASLINPDGNDIAKTEKLAGALNLKNRCRLFNHTLETANFSKNSFDLVTCVSVLEHIPEDRKAVEMMWSLLRPGGRLVLTLPCMAHPLEQYISRNDYGVLSAESDGYTFWQRYYDEKRLHSVIFEITGLPERFAVYGERSHGLFFRNATAKRLLGALYPFWRESYMMAREYLYFQKISGLPGEGVAMFAFLKP
jgi:SAM-dependent methyltransferase